MFRSYDASHLRSIAKILCIAALHGHQECHETGVGMSFWPMLDLKVKTGIKDLTSLEQHRDSAPWMVIYT